MMTSWILASICTLGIGLFGHWDPYQYFTATSLFAIFLRQGKGK